MLLTRRCKLVVLVVVLSLTLLNEFHHVHASTPDDEVVQEEACVSNDDGECINPDAAADAVDTEKPVEEEVEEPAASDEAPTTETEAKEEPATEEEEATEEVEETPEPVEEAVTDEETEPVEEPAQEPIVEEETKEEEPVEEEAPAPAQEEPPAPEKVPETAAEEEGTSSCPSRKHVIKCAGKYLDTNKNSKLERAELQAAIDKLPWWSRGILTILGSVDKMMAKCDVDGDDAIGMDYDMEHSKEQCLATCFKRRAFKAAFFPDCEA